MLSILYFILTVAATGLAIWYGGYYTPSVPGADYHMTYAWVSIGAAIIFGGLFAAGFVNRGAENPNVLLGGR
jgi:hypothetical protein